MFFTSQEERSTVLFEILFVFDMQGLGPTSLYTIWRRSSGANRAVTRCPCKRVREELTRLPPPLTTHDER